MGSVAGHIIPGAFFGIFGFWWIIASLWLYLSKKFKLRSAKTIYSDEVLDRKSNIPMPTYILSKVPLESSLKILLPLLGIIMESFFQGNGSGPVKTQIIHFHGADGNFTSVAELQHITMHSAFIVSGIVDLLSLCISYPKRTPQLFLSIAFLVEFFVFHNHVNGSEFNQLIHHFLAYVILSCVLFSSLRMLNSSNVLVNGGLGFAITLQGTWIIQIGLIELSDWDTNPENVNSIFIISCFVWHAMFVAVSMLVLLTLMQCVLQKCYLKEKRHFEKELESDEANEKLISNNETV